jgi:hypothetical protein
MDRVVYKLLIGDRSTAAPNRDAKFEYEVAICAVAYLSEWSLRQLAHLRISRFLNF